ncbi:MAG TPA: class I SAM-dependent methyltransferase [Pyrinomonadaceae bacterium]
MQKAINDKWVRAVGEIYGHYSVYYQSDGVEQAVFDGASGQSALRSARLLERLGAHVFLPKEGRMLDLGCGNGAMLRAFSRFAPGWRLAGSELSEQMRPVVESIERVEALYTGEPEQIPGRFDLLTTIHMIEHVPGPTQYLARLREKLNPDGLLLIEVPNFMQNPFDLLIADHASHFTARKLSALIRKAGYEVLWAATDWVPKELSLVARRAEPVIEQTPPPAEPDLFEAVTKMVRWLKETASSARAIAGQGSFGIFGTSIAGSWLSAEVGEAVSFFVDEDPSRTGKRFMGRVVYHPSQVPEGSHVFVGLPTILAEAIVRRVARRGVKFYLPPMLQV